MPKRVNQGDIFVTLLILVFCVKIRRFIQITLGNVVKQTLKNINYQRFETHLRPVYIPTSEMFIYARTDDRDNFPLGHTKYFAFLTIS